MIKRLGLAAIAALALLALYVPAQASSAFLCAPETAGAASGPRQVTNPETSTTYGLNGRGCAQIAVADISYFRAQGYTDGPVLRSLVYDIGASATATTAYPLGTLPAGAYVREIIVQNLTGTAVTGGIAFGTTANATDVVTALTCGATCLTQVTDANLKLRVFSTTATQNLFAAAVTAWANARVVITVIYGIF